MWRFGAERYDTAGCARMLGNDTSNAAPAADSAMTIAPP